MTSQTTPSAPPDPAPAAAGGPARPAVVKADPEKRRQALLLVLAVTLAGVVIVRFGIPWLEAWVWRAAAAGDVGARRLVCIGAGGAIAALGALVVASGVNMIAIGRRVVRGMRFPPEGLRPIRDVRLVEGPPARVLGRIQEFLGILLLLCASVLVGLGGFIVVRLWP